MSVQTHMAESGSNTRNRVAMAAMLLVPAVHLFWRAQYITSTVASTEMAALQNEHKLPHLPETTLR